MSAGGSERGAAARREQVRRRVLDEGYARTEDLVREFSVSLMTMHRDLDALATEGWVTKIRGGATANPSALVDAGVRERSSAMRAEKSAICAVAAELLSRGQTIFLDDSTTAMGIAPHLTAHVPVTVATNFLPAATELRDVTGVELYLLGGQYHPQQESCFGLQTEQAIANFSADLFLMSTTALTNGKCLHRSESTVAVRRAFLRHAARKVLLVDHAKFGRPAPHVLCEVSEFDIVITDDGVDDDDLVRLRDQVADVRVASSRP